MVTYKLFILMLKEIIGKVYLEHWATKVDHIAKCGITKPHTNNNRVERLNGTLRERVKVQRGQRIYYNFVKPHRALDGKTPAEKAGIKGKNKWLSLIREDK
jgi:hypothetical protein